MSQAIPKKSLLLVLLISAVFSNSLRAESPANEKSIEGKLDPFLSEAFLDMQPVFHKERFPNIVSAMDGTMIATFGTSNVRARRSEDGGKTWGDEIVIGKGFQGGGLTVDEIRSRHNELTHSGFLASDLAGYVVDGEWRVLAHLI